MVRLEIHPASAVDVIGNPVAILRRGVPEDFTPTEAAELLKLRSEHDSPLVQKVTTESNGSNE